MRWREGRRSSNIEDRRGASGAPLAAGGAFALMRFLPLLLRSKVGRYILVIGIVVVVGARALGVDVLPLLFGGGGSAVSGSNSRELSPEEAELTEFVSVVLGETEAVWQQKFQAMGREYREPTLVLFSGSVNSACGFAQSAMGPCYCPADQKVYIDLSFFRDLQNRHNAPGDFAQAYVIAHEVGHHVQTLLGISQQVHNQSQSLPKAEANALSVRQELQADCFAGIWGHAVHRERQLLEEGDLEEALTAAAAIGDDRLQQRSRGYVVPESFTHGTSEQRMRWFNRGFETGEVDACDTFAAAP